LAALVLQGQVLGVLQEVEVRQEGAEDQAVGVHQVQEGVEALIPQGGFQVLLQVLEGVEASLPHQEQVVSLHLSTQPLAISLGLWRAEPSLHSIAH